MLWREQGMNCAKCSTAYAAFYVLSPGLFTLRLVVARSDRAQARIGVLRVARISNAHGLVNLGCLPGCADPSAQEAFEQVQPVNV
jgi:hypothetical protein